MWILNRVRRLFTGRRQDRIHNEKERRDRDRGGDVAPVIQGERDMGNQRRGTGTGAPRMGGGAAVGVGDVTWMENVRIGNWRVERVDVEIEPGRLVGVALRPGGPVEVAHEEAEEEEEEHEEHHALPPLPPEHNHPPVAQPQPAHNPPPALQQHGHQVAQQGHIPLPALAQHPVHNPPQAAPQLRHSPRLLQIQHRLQGAPILPQRGGHVNPPQGQLPVAPQVPPVIQHGVDNAIMEQVRRTVQGYEDEIRHQERIQKRYNDIMRQIRDLDDTIALQFLNTLNTSPAVCRAHATLCAARHDTVNEVIWYKRAADAGDAWSCFRLHQQNVGTNQEQNHTIRALELCVPEVCYIIAVRIEAYHPHTAVRLWKIAAIQHYPKAQYKYAVHLARGLGCRVNLDMAAQYFAFAANQGIPDAQYEYALCLLHGRGCDQNDMEATRYFGLAAAQGILGAQYEYAMCLFQGRGCDQDFVMAAQHFKLSADQGHCHAQYHFALCLSRGNGCDRDLVAAAQYFKLSADRGVPGAQYEYAICLLYGCGCNQDPTVAAQYFKLSADQGYAEAQLQYGVALFRGCGCVKDVARSIHYFQLSADQGNANAQFFIGVHLLNRRDGDRDRAIQYIKLAADQGQHVAQLDYAKLIRDQQPAESMRYLVLAANHGYAAAREYLKNLADQGDPEAQRAVGIQYFDGIGCPQNYATALHYFQLAAAQGNASAQCRVGYLLLRGRGCAQDLGEAARYFDRAAAQGHHKGRIYLQKLVDQGVPEAQCYHGVNLFHKQDLAGAARYFKLSADQGYPMAQFLWGNSLLNGYGCIADYDEALQYFRLAADQGVPEAQAQLDAIQVANESSEPNSSELEEESRSQSRGSSESEDLTLCCPSRSRSRSRLASRLGARVQLEFGDEVAQPEVCEPEEWSESVISHSSDDPNADIPFVESDSNEVKQFDPEWPNVSDPEYVYGA